MKFIRTSVGDKPKPFMEHLEDLRVALLRILVALTLGVLLAAPLAPWLLRVLTASLNRIGQDPNVFLRSIEVTGAFALWVRLALWGGLLLSAPFILLFVGAFVFPGLTSRERSVVIRAGGFSVLLFVAGALLGYGVMLPMALRVMLRMHANMGIAPNWTVNSYVGFSTHLLIGFGLAFQLPVVLLGLGRLGIVDAEMLAKKRRHVIVGLLVVAMLLTPPDVLTQVMMALPLVMLYELCIWMLRLMEHERKVDNGKDRC